MSKTSFLIAILFLSIALPVSSALADLRGAATGAETGEAQQGRQDPDVDSRLLERFRAAKLSLTQAIEIAEGLHRGSRAVAAAFELVDAAGYRVITVKNDETWENLIEANTGRVLAPELSSPLDQFGRDEQRNIVALKSVAEELLDAVRVAEKAANGKAFGGGLVNQEGKLNFFVVVLSDGDLKEVRLEPPKAGRKGSELYRLR